MSFTFFCSYGDFDYCIQSRSNESVYKMIIQIQKQCSSESSSIPKLLIPNVCYTYFRHRSKYDKLINNHGHKVACQPSLDRNKLIVEIKQATRD